MILFLDKLIKGRLRKCDLSLIYAIFNQNL